MTPEEQAAEAARVASLSPEELEAENAAKTPKPYTDDELKTFTPTSQIEMERVPENYRPIIENMTRDYKNLAADHTRKAQELAELKKSQEKPEPETYFDDTTKDGVFKDYIKSPLKVISEINAEIANLEAVIPDDGADEYRAARKKIAYWNGIKDEFSAKRIEVSERHRQAEADEARISGELGADAATLIEYAKTQGFTEKDFKKNKAVREAVTKLYQTENALATALKKETKPNPPNNTRPAGGGGGGGDNEDDEFNLPLSERIKRSEARRYAT